MKKTSTRYSPELRERAVRMVLEHQGELTLLLQAQKQQAAMAPASVRKLAARTIAALVRELAAIEKMMKALINEHATPALRSSKGLGPVFQATVLALWPELGHLDRRQIAKLTGGIRGLGPMNLALAERNA